MKECTGVINGCAKNFLTQVEELNTFFASYIDKKVKTKTIVFYQEEDKEQEFMSYCQTDYLLLVKVQRYQPETILMTLEEIEKEKMADIYVFGSDFAGNELCPRFAYRIKGSSLIGVNEIYIDNDKCEAYKNVYSNHMRGQFELSKKPYCIAIAKGFKSIDNEQKREIKKVIKIDATGTKKDDFILSYQLQEAEQVASLEDASFLIVAGRGARTKQKVEQIQFIAKDFGASFGVTRPVAMNGWAPMSTLVGVSGAMCKPKITIIAGASGAAAFTAGIERSDFIIAINNDSHAPIIKCADVAVIDDYETVLEALYRYQTK